MLLVVADQSRSLWYNLRELQRGEQRHWDHCLQLAL